MMRDRCRQRDGEISYFNSNRGLSTIGETGSQLLPGGHFVITKTTIIWRTAKFPEKSITDVS